MGNLDLTKQLEKVWENNPFGNPRRRGTYVQAGEPFGRDVLIAAATYFRMPVGYITSQRRDAKTIYARHLSMFVMFELTNKSTPQIGKLFGDRDHTTVIHAVKKVRRWLAENRETIAADVNALTAFVTERTAPKSVLEEARTEYAERLSDVSAMSVGDCRFFPAIPTKVRAQQALLFAAKQLGIKISTKAVGSDESGHIAVMRVG